MAHKLHGELLTRVTKAPVNLYFDITPIGKLMSNFTSDIGKTDRAFFHSINWVMGSVADCMVKVGFAIYYSPMMIFAVGINLMWLYFIQNKTMQGKSECVRLNSKQGKKLSSHFTEVFDGLTLIRAFDKQADLRMDCNKILNDDLICEFFDTWCHFYFQVRLLSFSNFMFVAVGAMCISLRGAVESTMLALLFQQL